MKDRYPCPALSHLRGVRAVTVGEAKELLVLLCTLEQGREHAERILGDCSEALRRGPLRDLSPHSEVPVSIETVEVPRYAPVNRCV